MKLSQVEPEQLEQFSKEQLVRIVLQQRGELGALKKVLSTTNTDNPNSGRCPMNFLFSQKDRYPEFVWGTGHLKQVNIEDLFPSSCIEKLTQPGLETDFERLVQRILEDEQLRLERAVRDALRHLNDLMHLNRCLLLKIAITRQADIDGAGLQERLIEAIDSVKPKKVETNYQRRQIRYDILRLTYLRRKPLYEIISILAVSERQYYRELKIAIRTVLEHISKE